jgi:hypothetical protein
VDIGLTVGQSVFGALAATVVLAGLHLAALRLRKLPFVPARATGSFAGGLAVAYVFLHLLPEIAAGNEAIGEALSDVIEPTPLVELGIFPVALTGFTIFYALERLAARTAPRTLVTTGHSGTGQECGASSGVVYRAHLGSFLVYNALITYTMALRLRTGILFGVLFTVAMGLHFVLTDRPALLAMVTATSG